MDMRKSIYFKNIIFSIFITAMLAYFMIKTPSPKIIFVPFLICSCSMAGENISLLLGKGKLAVAFHKLFAVGFLLFLFGFLFVAAYLSIRDKNYTLLVFSVPFWLVGLVFAKNKLFLGNTKRKRKAKKAEQAAMIFPIAVTAFLVIIVLLIGIVTLISGIKDGNGMLAFFGAFFLFGAFTFVLAALTLKGYFDKWKINILGMYIGCFLAIVGIGSVVLKYTETYSFEKMLEEFGLWIIVPILMIAGGILEVVQCIRNRKK